MDHFEIERELGRKNTWRVVRITGQERVTLPRRYLKETTAQAAAYTMTVAAERRHNRTIYLGD